MNPPYNASVLTLRLVHNALMILRIRPDAGVPGFQAGQYATLGLGNWEPRIEDVQSEQLVKPPSRRELVRRAYSISCPLLDEHGRLTRCRDLDFLEFYITRVDHPTDDPPRLTPRLFALTAGSRLYSGPRPHGTYTLAACAVEDNLVFLATGTGEAPHNAMIADLLARGHRGAIVSAVCVRYRVDLGYLDAHRELERRFGNYRYIALTTREPENLDPNRPDYRGKLYLQQFVGSGQLEKETGIRLDPAHTHVYLCGNPDMIGLPPPLRRGLDGVPEAGGMVELLLKQGFRLHRSHAPGNLHVERFW